jgi:hypothetical protein
MCAANCGRASWVNGVAALLRPRNHHGCSMKKKAKKKFGDATCANVRKEMAKTKETQCQSKEQGKNRCR